ncbi:hypothetical protein J0910_26680 [Nocardiopsis sp. CNT-189]|uniref:GDSL-type esterase/lipase family protein n=1 Tax=Nocardiopsis oceanisediminis TaxID=2816862 RepID=UPI003B3675A4
MHDPDHGGNPPPSPDEGPGRCSRVLARLRGAARRPRAGGRFQPGALGLSAVALAAMCATLVVIQTFGGTFRTGGDPEPEPSAPPAVGTPPEGTARVMIAGDSLVQGSTGDFTWRYRLWKHLAASGADVDFVGPYDDIVELETGEFGDDGYADPDFDTAHAGVWGATAENVAAGIGEQVAEYEPDYLLLMAGTNDFVHGGSAADALEGVRDAVGNARVADGGLQIVLGEVTPNWGTGRDEELNEKALEFNRLLPGLAEELGGPAPVVVAHTAEGYAPADDNWDTTHPNARGELKIAAAFADALAGPLRLGEPYPRPLPEVDVGPRRAPSVQAEEEGGEVVLTWEPVPGATGYQVLQQRVDPDPDDRVPLPAEVGGSGDEPRTATVDRLLSGATYEFVVRPYKGGDGGAGSEPARITVDADPPPAPDRVRLEDGDTVLAWDEVPDAGHYEVLRRAMSCERPADPGGAGPDGEDGGSGPGDCSPVDGNGPGRGAGWSTAALVEGGATEWTVSAPAGGAYEFAVRSHRDYVEGGHSETVEYVPED